MPATVSRRDFLTGSLLACAGCLAAARSAPGLLLRLLPDGRRPAVRLPRTSPPQHSVKRHG